jgi:hypothetical protein
MVPGTAAPGGGFVSASSGALARDQFMTFGIKSDESSTYYVAQKDAPNGKGKLP